MARPPKTTVDYFTHDARASEGKTLSIIFNNFGHEGLSAWWLLLERISVSNNHVIVCNNSEEWEFLASKLKLSLDKTRLILSKLAELNAIDIDLFKSDIIWCQNFVNRLSDLYDRRKQPLPLKPSLKQVYDNINPVPAGINPVPVRKSPQEPPILNNIKLNNIILEETKEEEPPTPLTPEVSSSSSSRIKEFTPEQQSCIDSYAQNICNIVTPIIGDSICLAVEDFTASWVLDAIREACIHEKRSWAYVIKILQTWKQNGKNNGQKPTRNRVKGDSDGKTKTDATPEKPLGPLERRAEDEARAKLERKGIEEWERLHPTRSRVPKV